MAKVCTYIDGTNHVARIAALADCDLDLTRKAVSHLLHVVSPVFMCETDSFCRFYQVIMMIDIFQFSNMYSMCRSIEYLAKEPHVQEECGPYVTKSDREILEWPHLLHLYSRLKPGVTVFEWMNTYDVHSLGIDPRRFTSFGVIKGFLRRVHRWPVFTAEVDKDQSTDKRAASTSPSVGRRRGKSLNITTASVASTSTAVDAPHILQQGDRLTSPTARRMSEAEKYLEQFRREIRVEGGRSNTMQIQNAAIQTSGSIVAYPRASLSLRGEPFQGGFAAREYERDLQRRHSLAPTMSSTSTTAASIPVSLNGLFSSASTDHGEGNASGVSTPTRPRLSRSPSTQSQSQYLPAQPPTNANVAGSAAITAPAGLKPLLDGTRHSDELGVLFDAGWPLLEKYLIAIGGGRGAGDFGKVVVIYR